MKVDLYLHTTKEYTYEKGEELGLAGEALDTFVYTGYEHKITYEVNAKTGESTAIALDDIPLSTK